MLPKGDLEYEGSLNDLAFKIYWAAKSNQVWKWLRCLEKRNERNKKHFNTEGTECQEVLYLLIYDATLIFYDSGIEKIMVVSQNITISSNSLDRVLLVFSYPAS